MPVEKFWERAIIYQATVAAGFQRTSRSAGHSPAVVVIVRRGCDARAHFYHERIWLAESR